MRQSAFSLRGAVIVLLAGVLLTSCGIFRSEQVTRFSPEVVKLGMTKEKFIREFGHPSMQNTYIEDGVTVDELVYIEAIFFRAEARKVNSKFVFRDGRLVRREQAEDPEYLQQQQFKKFIEMQQKPPTANEE